MQSLSLSHAYSRDENVTMLCNSVRAVFVGALFTEYGKSARSHLPDKNPNLLYSSATPSTEQVSAAYKGTRK